MTPRYNPTDIVAYQTLFGYELMNYRDYAREDGEPQRAIRFPLALFSCLDECVRTFCEVAEPVGQIIIV